MIERFSRVKNGFKVTKNGVYRSAVIHDYEVIFLKHIYLHRQLRATSVHELIKVLSKREIAKSNISNRLNKLVNAGVLVRNQEKVSDLSANFVRYFYRLGPVALDLLIYLKQIDERNMKSYVQNPYNQKTPSIHNKAASILTNLIAIECIKRNMEFDFCRGVNHSYLGNDAKTRESENLGLIIPDYVFENAEKNVLVAIELDTGHQRTQVINKKIEKYILQANSDEYKNVNFVVVFAVLDNYISEMYETDRARRVYSLKSNFESKHDIPKNMQLYAVNTEQSLNLIPSILMQSNKLDAIEKDFLCEDFMEIYIERYKQDFKKVVIPNVPASIRFNAVYENYSNNKRNLVFLLYREEGALIDYQKSEGAISYLNRIKENDNKITLIYIYDTAESALSDVTSASVEGISIVTSYVPNEEDEELVIYKHTALLTKKPMRGFLYEAAAREV